MAFIDFIVKSSSGKNTNLDKAYNKLINNVLVEMNEETEERWETYNLIIKEFFVIDNGKYFEEIKYRLTDDEDPNHVILDVASRYHQDEINFLLTFLLKRVEEYSDEDFFKRYL